MLRPDLVFRYGELDESALEDARPAAQLAMRADTHDHATLCRMCDQHGLLFSEGGTLLPERNTAPRGAQENA